MTRESYVFYLSFEMTLRKMDAENELLARRAISDYVFFGKEPKKDVNIIVQIFFDMAKPIIDKNNKNYENGKNGGKYGKLGGRPKKTDKTPKKPPENPEKTPNPSNDVDKDKDKDEDKDKEVEKELDVDVLKENTTKEKPIEPEIIMPEKKTKRFQKPTIDEIAAYCQQRNNGIDAEQFFAYYESKGWKIGKTPMKDWKAAVITWEKHRQKNTFSRPTNSLTDEDDGRMSPEQEKAFWNAWNAEAEKIAAMQQKEGEK